MENNIERAAKEIRQIEAMAYPQDEYYLKPIAHLLLEIAESLQALVNSSVNHHQSTEAILELLNTNPWDVKNEQEE